MRKCQAQWRSLDNSLGLEIVSTSRFLTYYRDERSASSIVVDQSHIELLLRLFYVDIYGKSSIYAHLLALDYLLERDNFQTSTMRDALAQVTMLCDDQGSIDGCPILQALEGE